MMGIKRLQNELRKACVGGLKDSGVSSNISLHEDNLGVWHFSVDSFQPPEASINKDLEVLGKPIFMEARFPSDYPNSPFMLRILWPPCQPYTGHVTVGGTICTQVLTPSGWNAEFTFEGVLRSTLYEMANSNSGKGGLRVDFTL